MEYLAIRGSVEIDKCAPFSRLLNIIGNLMDVEFENMGYADHKLDMDTLQLSVFVDGPISDGTAHFIENQLDALRPMLAANSQILIVRERWEINVTLWCPNYAHQFLAGILLAPKAKK